MIRLALRVRRGQAEIVLAELLELAPSGVEEVQLEDGTVEYAVYGAPGELPGLPDLNAVAGEALVEISTSETPDDWHERWRQFHRPVMIDGPPARRGAARRVPGLHVRPPWEAPSAQTGQELLEIVIDPGQAFGTGGHDSTRLCLALLLELTACIPAPGALLDIGGGSGVLAIAAAQLGFAPVLALDHELESVAATAQNAAVNACAVDARRLDLRVEELPWLEPAGRPAGSLVVLANLLRPLLLELAEKMPSPPDHLVAGGLLRHEVDEVAAAFAERLGLRERERRESGEWGALWLSER